MKKWNIDGGVKGNELSLDTIVAALLKKRGVITKKQIDAFFHPPHPKDFTCEDVHINKTALRKILTRIKKAIDTKESIVVYADYDADGISAGATLWEALFGLGAHVMPYIPDRKEEGYGFSKKGLDAIKKEHNPTLVISVDHGITAYEFVEYGKSLGMEVIVTDHHLKPEKVPKCLILHTTELSGAGVAFFLAKELSVLCHLPSDFCFELLPLAAIGTIADMVPLVGPNRSIAKYGLDGLKKTTRVGLTALMENAGIIPESITTYSVSHLLAPRLNAMGRLTHALDALRLLCTKNRQRAKELANTLGLTNRERQQLTLDTILHAKGEVVKMHGDMVHKKLLVLSHASYNQGIIGLVAGKLVEEHFRPVIVISQGSMISKASARSIPGFNIVEAIRSLQELLIDVGGHPLAAGFTIETKHIPVFQEKLESYADAHITDDMLKQSLRVDLEIPLSCITDTLWEKLKNFEPYGLGNPEPVFATRGVTVADVRQIGVDGKHLKLRFSFNNRTIEQWNNSFIDAVAFNMGNLYAQLKPSQLVDIAYTIDRNEWNGKSLIQLKIRDIHYSASNH